MFNFSLFYFFIVLFFLIISSYTDFKKRIVLNKVVLFFLILGILFKILESVLFSSFNILLFSILSFIICFIIFYILWSIGVFSAGDVKVFLVISIFIPNNLVFLNILDKIYVLSKPIFSLNLLFFSIFSILPFILFFAVIKLFNIDNLILIKNKIFKKYFLESILNSVIILFLVSSFLSIFSSFLNSFYIFIFSLFFIFFFNKLKSIINKGTYIFYVLFFTFLFIYNFYIPINVFNFNNFFSIILSVSIIFVLLVLYTIIRNKIFTYTKSVDKLKEGDLLYYNYYFINNMVYTKKYNFIKYIFDILKNNYYINLKIDSRHSAGILKSDIIFLNDSYNHNLIEKEIKLKKTVPFIPSVLIAYIILNIIGDVFWFII
ncbi:MAG: A24 family peptidase [Candidatus ainarchaeum sp.]|nr:A24 family peptidase [Candidatus ainarchaeum sp.]MDD3975883.1 A24 family peptidase [Candidatus ainarchaeum sp.]